MIVRIAEYAHWGIDKFLRPHLSFLRGERECRRVSCCLKRSSVLIEQPVMVEVLTRALRMLFLFPVTETKSGHDLWHHTAKEIRL